MMSIQTVGRYEITGELGRGAMGVVYKALDPTIGRTVALKTMRLDVHGLDAQEMVRRFQNEARAAGVLNHPNIVTIYDAGEQDGIFYIAMEFIEGTTLHELLAEKRVLATDEVLQLTRQICRGLDYAHSNGIVHRDIKPANIMITGNGTVKIMDFGIAKSGGQVTNTGQVLGTPNYMAPEQVKGRQLDGRSDLFSLGVILYEMLTGEKPFVGQNVTTIIYKIVNENPITPRDLDVTVHPGLSAIVTKALAKAPDDRYQTGADLVRDLENYKLAGPAAHRIDLCHQPRARCTGKDPGIAVESGCRKYGQGRRSRTGTGEKTYSGKASYHGHSFQQAQRAAGHHCDYRGAGQRHGRLCVSSDAGKDAAACGRSQDQGSTAGGTRADRDCHSRAHAGRRKKR